MFTIDASVHVNALSPMEAGSTDSQAFLEYVYQHSFPVSAPTLLLVEVAAVVARAFNDAAHGVALAQALRLLPGQIWIPLDERLARQASQLAAQYRLRGADAVYAAVAHVEKTTLVTLDHQQLERLSAFLTVVRPTEALARCRKARAPAARRRKRA
ncbi:MAG: PIN domain-containing protein [Chloroflexi bacterium]|nr:PIN domain-containing protein [Chloroflexota bacterium]